VELFMWLSALKGGGGALSTSTLDCNPQSSFGA